MTKDKPLFPDSYKASSKPSKFCPGCGHSLALKSLGQVLDAKMLKKKAVFGIDIGCSLLAWDFYDVDTVQTHHGRTVPVVSGIKMGNKNAVAIAYLGDGGAYAIGLQALLHSVKRNDPITVIVINNTLYGMTGGQKAPTTLKGEITTSTPDGKFTDEEPLFGPELVSYISGGRAYVARASVSNLFDLKKKIDEALDYQIKGKGFSFVEVLSMCPLNWKTNAKESLEFLKKDMEDVFPVGIICKGTC